MTPIQRVKKTILSYLVGKDGKVTLTQARMEALYAEIDLLIAAAEALPEALSLEKAIGDILDRHGREVGLSRPFGMLDSEYKPLVKAENVVLSSSGLSSDFNKIFSFIDPDAKRIRYLSLGNQKLIVEYESDEPTMMADILVDNLRRSLVDGAKFVSIRRRAKNSFVLSEESVPWGSEFVRELDHKSQEIILLENNHIAYAPLSGVLSIEITNEEANAPLSNVTIDGNVYRPGVVLSVNQGDQVVFDVETNFNGYYTINLKYDGGVYDQAS